VKGDGPRSVFRRRSHIRTLSFFFSLSLIARFLASSSAAARFPSFSKEPLGHSLLQPAKRRSSSRRRLLLTRTSTLVFASKASTIASIIRSERKSKKSLVFLPSLPIALSLLSLQACTLTDQARLTEKKEKETRKGSLSTVT